MTESDPTPAPAFDRGPLRTYEVIWRSGYVHTIEAHQVMCPFDMPLFGAKASPWFTFHAEIDGQWLLVLRVREDDIQSIRIATAEATP